MPAPPDPIGLALDEFYRVRSARMPEREAMRAAIDAYLLAEQRAGIADGENAE